MKKPQALNPISGEALLGSAVVETYVGFRCRIECLGLRV